MGAWIETNILSIYQIFISKSHPTWVRGLKRVILIFLDSVDRSHPTWVRGLKRQKYADIVSEDESHPTWVRGLKLWGGGTLEQAIYVAPYVGAWIETWSRMAVEPSLPSRTLRGCVD